MTNRKLVYDMDDNCHELGRLAREGERRLKEQSSRYLLWQVVTDFMAEGSAVCGPLFHPETISERRQQLEEVLERNLVAEIAQHAHRAGQLVKEAARRAGNPSGQDMPREVAWAIIKQENGSTKRDALLVFLNKEYPQGV